VPLHALLTLEDGTLACAERVPFRSAPGQGTLCLVRAADGFSDPARFLRAEEREAPPHASEAVDFVSFATRAEAARALSNAAAALEARQTICDELSAMGREALLLRLRYSLRRERLVVQLSPQSFTDAKSLRDVISSKLRCQVDVRIVMQRSLAAAIGGLGVCGRRICCSLGISPPRDPSGSAPRPRDTSPGLCNRPCCCISF